LGTTQRNLSNFSESSEQSCGSTEKPLFIESTCKTTPPFESLPVFPTSLSPSQSLCTGRIAPYCTLMRPFQSQAQIVKEMLTPIKTIQHHASSQCKQSSISTLPSTYTPEKDPFPMTGRLIIQSSYQNPSHQRPRQLSAIETISSL
jgi:hypothetical protein